MSTTDLEQRIMKIVVGTRVQADIPGAILAEIGRTHVLVERGRWQRVGTVTIDAQRWDRVAYAARLAAHYQLASLKPGDGDDVDRDLEPIRHAAAESDTPEIT